MKLCHFIVFLILYFEVYSIHYQTQLKTNNKNIDDIILLNEINMKYIHNQTNFNSNVFNFKNKTNSSLEQPDFLRKTLDKQVTNKKKKLKGELFNEEKYINNLYKNIQFGENKTKDINNEQNFNIESLISEIRIIKSFSHGIVYEKVRYEVPKGKHTRIVRKISLSGTSDKIHSFKLGSRDVRLKNARIMNNCLDSTSFYEHPYICIEAKFEEIRIIDEFQIIELEYEYVADNILRKREKPFSNKEYENVLIWIFDNYKVDSIIRNLKFKFVIENEIKNFHKLIAYPEKFALINQIQNEKYAVISWELRDIKPNDYKNFALNIPHFNLNCKGINEIHLEITTYSLIQFFIWISFAFIIIIITIVIYLSNHQHAEKTQKEEGKQQENTSSNTNNSIYSDSGYRIYNHIKLKEHYHD